MPDRDRDPDDFWDVENLLPRQNTRKTPPPPRPSPDAVEIQLEPVEPPARPTTDGQEPSGQPSPQGATASQKPVASVPLTVQSPDTAETHFVPPYKPTGQEPDAPLSDYQPEGVLLHRVRIYRWEANYHYFDQFADDAIRYQKMRPLYEAGPEPFFSYFPQYAQLSRRRLNWYLRWREGVRRGTYMDTDYSYILLYLFELINLPAEDPATAREHRDLMAKVWMAYRRSYPQLDHYMCEWLCDYCLIHALTAPVDLLTPALDEIIMGSRLKEFYLSAAVRVPAPAAVAAGEAVDTSMETARILMRHCCQYDYHKSKFAGGEHKELFDSTIPAAIAAVIPLLLGGNRTEEGSRPLITMLDSTLTRDAYTGALCSYRNKRRIEVAYTSFSRSHELRFLIGDMVKHVENRLRSWIGVRSRLSVMSLPIPLRDALDTYLAPLEPPKSVAPVKKKAPARPDYEALYDLPAKELSLKDAAAIEADSWETTRILVEAFEDSDPPPTPEAPSKPPVTPDVVASTATIPAIPPVPDGTDTPPVTPPQTTDWSTALQPYRTFIRAALTADRTAQKQAAASLGKMPDAIADEVNTLTADPDLPGNPICDILLEDNGTGCYEVVEDYREEAEEVSGE